MLTVNCIHVLRAASTDLPLSTFIFGMKLMSSAMGNYFLITHIITQSLFFKHTKLFF